MGWSAAGPAPTAAELADPTPERLAETVLGEFLVVRRALGPVVVLAYVPLARHYGISNRYLREGPSRRSCRGCSAGARHARAARRNQESGGRAGGYPGALFVLGAVQLPGSLVAGRLPLLLLLLSIGCYTAAWLGISGPLVAAGADRAIDAGAGGRARWRCGRRCYT
ncbi:MAG: hypothetical protein WKG07_15820 [Hymenobacter sp.]